MSTHNQNRKRILARILLASCLLLAPSVWAQGTFTFTNTTNFTFSNAEFDTYNTTNVTQQVNTFQVELKARMQGGSYLFDQTYNVAFSDPTVQAAITQAKNLLTNAGAASFTGPTQLSSNPSTTSATNTVQTGTATQLLAGAATWIGPATFTVGDRGVCQSYTPLSGSGGPSGLNTVNSGSYGQLTGCSLSGQAGTLLTGQVDIDTLIRSLVTINQTATTTNTTLTTQVYEIDGAPAGSSPPATPAPPSLLLALTGIAASGLYALRRRLRGSPQRGS